MMKIVTHSGHFHTDDLLAIAALLIKYPEAQVVRSRDEDVILSGDIVVDVGKIYDSDKNRFDHHQPEGAGKRDNGIPYASLGLVWKKIGEDVAGGKEEALVIDEKIVAGVDAIDNGVELGRPMFDGVREYSIGDYFQLFADGAESLEEYDKGFFGVLPIAIDFLKREIEIAKYSVRDWKAVEKIYAESSNKQIITLPLGMHWKKVLIPTEAIYVVSPRQDGTWGVRAVPVKKESFEVKRRLPIQWAGLSNEQFEQVSGVKDVVFCHRDLWLARTKTEESAIKLAEISLNT